MRTALVVTTINRPNPVLQALADGAVASNIDFIVAGDTKSPPDFHLAGCRYLDIPAQESSGFTLGRLCPTKHYARKNLAYLDAIERGAELLLETDDDNLPREAFFRAPRSRVCTVRGLAHAGWVNVYRYFSEAQIWPRGLPLDAVTNEVPLYDSLALSALDCPIQQGLADDNPDVDAIYRLLQPLPQRFRLDRRVALGPGAWCPFNSQNTLWWRDAFPLLYLPSFCSFRMTDIWRSLVAQRVATLNGWWILFHEPTVTQERNEHDLMRDFEDEVPGYLHNRSIARTLDSLPLQPGLERLGDSLRDCYLALIALGVIGANELALVDAWLFDLRRLGIISR